MAIALIRHRARTVQCPRGPTVLRLLARPMAAIRTVAVVVDHIRVLVVGTQVVVADIRIAKKMPTINVARLCDRTLSWRSTAWTLSDSYPLTPEHNSLASAVLDN